MFPIVSSSNWERHIEKLGSDSVAQRSRCHHLEALVEMSSMGMVSVMVSEALMLTSGAKRWIFMIVILVKASRTIEMFQKWAATIQKMQLDWGPWETFFRADFSNC